MQESSGPISNPNKVDSKTLQAGVVRTTVEASDYTVGSSHVDSQKNIVREKPQATAMSLRWAEQNYSEALVKPGEGLTLPALDQTNTSEVNQAARKKMAEQDPRADIFQNLIEAANQIPDGDKQVKETAQRLTDEKNRLLALGVPTTEQHRRIEEISAQLDLSERVLDARTVLGQYEAEQASLAALEQATVTQEKIRQNELLKRQQQAQLLKETEGVITASNDGSNDALKAKATAIRQLQPGLDLVVVLNEQGIRLNARTARLLGKLEGDENKYLAKAEDDAVKEARKQVEFPIRTTNLDKLTKIAEDAPLTDPAVQERSRLIQVAQDELFSQVDAIRAKNGPDNKPLSHDEKKDLAKAWGIRREGGDGTPQVLKVEPGSSMEAFLIAQAIKADGKLAYRENMEAVRNGNTDVVEAATASANMVVQGEVLEQVATTMLVGDMNSARAQEALKAAHALGLVNEAGQLHKLLYGGQEKLKEAGSELIKRTGEMWRKFSELMKNPEMWKKLGKALLFGLAAAAVVAILVSMGGTSLVGNLITGMSGGGGSTHH